jgi:putative PIN family toxin of toxin-antitoxin system
MRLVIDTNILVGELLRERGRELIQHSDLALSITERILDETQYELRRRLRARVRRGGLTEATAQEILASAMRLIETKITLVAEAEYSHLETEARNRIPRDPDDWFTVALALEMEAAIWTQDCDFLGCGCPTWTTQTLLIQLRNAD